MSILSFFTDPITAVLRDVLSMAVQILPSVGNLSLDFAGSINMIFATAKQYGFLFDWNVIFTCVYAVLICRIALFAYDRVVWIIGVIRGSGT